MASTRLSTTEYDYKFKILLIGDYGTGKSCVILRFADNSFTESYISTIGVDFKLKTIEIRGKTINLQIWDTASRERIERWKYGETHSYYRETDGIIIVCDITDKESFNPGIREWMMQILRYGNEKAQVLIIGNKMDKIKKESPDNANCEDIMLVFGYIRKFAINKYNLNFPSCIASICLKYWPKFKVRIRNEKQLSYQDAKMYADEYGIEYIETSAKTGEYVEYAFYRLIIKILDKTWNPQTELSLLPVDNKGNEDMKSTPLLNNHHIESCCNCVLL